MKTLEDAKLVLDIRNTTCHLRKKTKASKTWKELALMLIVEFSKDNSKIKPGDIVGYIEQRPLYLSDLCSYIRQRLGKS